MTLTRGGTQTPNDGFKLVWKREVGWHVALQPVEVLQCGTKAVGLTQVPPKWTLPWVVLPLKSCVIAKRDDAWDAAAQTLIEYLKDEDCHFDGGLLARSSSSDESLDLRGHFESIHSAAEVAALARSLRQVAFQGLPGNLNDPSNKPTCAVVVQIYASHRELGHLSNEYRHAQRSVDFLFEADESGGSLQLGPQRFRLDRPVAPPATSLLLYTVNNDVEPPLKTVGRWLAAQNLRAHVEWVVEEGRLYVVQLDWEPPPELVPPMSRVATACGPWDALWKPGRFQSLGLDVDCSDLRKTRSHQLLRAAGAVVPPIYLARQLSESDLADHSRFWRDIAWFVQRPAMVRFDVGVEKREWTNLPTCGPLRSYQEAENRIRTAINGVVDRGIPLEDLTVVMHHFVPARASAWSEATPHSSIVRIDATWGLPDGLQSLIHDSLLCDSTTGSITRQIRFKDRFIDVEDDGSWVTRRAYPALASDPACSAEAAKQIAHVTHRLSKQLNKAVRVMWFLDLVKSNDEKPATAIPWILVELEDRAHGLSPALPAAATMLRRRADLHLKRRVKDWASLSRFEETPEQMDVGGRVVLLQPDAVVVRSRSFLARFAKAVKSLPNHWKVIYAGSMLAHAPYQLQQHGVAVIPLHQEVRPPRRTYMRKLVRDGIPSRIAESGEHAEVVQLSQRDYELALRQKLVEEALEVAYSSDRQEVKQELADLLAVAHALAKANGLESWTDVELEEQEKMRRRGGFEQRLFLRATGHAPGDSAITPGGVHVTWLSGDRGVRIPLIPPLLSPDQEHRVILKRTGFEVTVRFRENIVEVLFGSAQKAGRQAQLRLPFAE